MMASPDEKKEPAADLEEEGEPGNEPDGSGDFGADFLASLLSQAHIGEEEPKVEQVLEEVNIDGIVKYLSSGKAKNILVMAGAGISTSAGIPDFRSPGSGLYDNLAKYNLPNPQAIFELGYFRENPEPFFQLAKELWPGVFKPTPSHYFIRLLHEKGLLLRHYTQNIDTLERVSGLPGDKVVEAHGTFHTSHCLKCRHQYSQEWMKEQVFSKTVPTCIQDDCDGLVKPDIVFFGEALPERFFTCTETDLSNCDLLIIMGTSLVVQPFASLASRIPDTCPRLYINLEAAPSGDPLMALLGYGHGFKFDQPDNYRDVFYQGNCDAGCFNLADKLGWSDELWQLLKTGHDKIDAEISASESKQSSKTASSTGQSEGSEQAPSQTDEDSKKDCSPKI